MTTREKLSQAIKNENRLIRGNFRRWKYWNRRVDKLAWKWNHKVGESWNKIIAFKN
jgi:hypothetical protein